jgi:hypothetical protein
MDGKYTFRDWIDAAHRQGTSYDTAAATLCGVTHVTVWRTLTTRAARKHIEKVRRLLTDATRAERVALDAQAYHTALLALGDEVKPRKRKRT